MNNVKLFFFLLDIGYCKAVYFFSHKSPIPGMLPTLPPCLYNNYSIEYSIEHNPIIFLSIHILFE